MAKPLVVLVHGINDNAGWHSKVRNILEPHFECRSVRYREYHCMGGVQILFWFGMLVLVAAVALAAGGWNGALIGLLVAVSAVVFVHELDWNAYELNGARTAALAVLLLLPVAAVALAWYVVPRQGLVVLLLAVGAEVACLEGRAYCFQDRDRSWWVVWPGSLPPLTLLAWFAVTTSAWWWALLLPLALLAAVAEPFSRRGRAQTKVYRQFGGLLGADRPHVIAHSLGSFLTGQILRQLKGANTIRPRSLLLVGCVLPRDYDWGAVPVAEVRNEQGGGDWVVLLASLLPLPFPFLSAVLRKGRGDGMVLLANLLGWFRPWSNFGGAGRWGFVGSPEGVHDVADDYSGCERCADGAALVHNVLLPGFAHSDAFLSEIHAFRLWLPYLWAIFPGEFEEFLRLCRAGVEALDPPRNRDGRPKPVDRLGYEAAKKAFNTRPWNQTRQPGKGKYALQIVEDVLQVLKADPTLTPAQKNATAVQVYEELFRKLCVKTGAAARLLDPDWRGPAPADREDRDDLLLWLNPRYALSQAVQEILLTL